MVQPISSERIWLKSKRKDNFWISKWRHIPCEYYVSFESSLVLWWNSFPLLDEYVSDIHSLSHKLWCENETNSDTTNFIHFIAKRFRHLTCVVLVHLLHSDFISNMFLFKPDYRYTLNASYEITLRCSELPDAQRRCDIFCQWQAVQLQCQMCNSLKLSTAVNDEFSSETNILLALILQRNQNSRKK